MARKPKTVYSANNGKLYVMLKAAGIEYLVAMIDGLPCVFFKGSKNAHILVEDAIKWHEKELTFAERPGSRDAIKAMQEMLDKFNAEQASVGESTEAT